MVVKEMVQFFEHKQSDQISLEEFTLNSEQDNMKDKEIEAYPEEINDADSAGILNLQQPEPIIASSILVSSPSSNSRKRADSAEESNLDYSCSDDSHSTLIESSPINLNRTIDFTKSRSHLYDDNELSNSKNDIIDDLTNNSVEDCEPSISNISSSILKSASKVEDINFNDSFTTLTASLSVTDSVSLHAESVDRASSTTASIIDPPPMEDPKNKDYRYNPSQCQRIVEMFQYKQNTKGHTPLSMAANQCFSSGINILLEAGSNVEITDKFGQTCLHLACNNISAVEHHESINLLVKHHTFHSIKNSQDHLGQTGLHIAAKNKCAKCIKTLLEAGCCASIQDHNGNTPLHIAIQTEDMNCTSTILNEAGRCDNDCTFCNTTSSNSSTSLSMLNRSVVRMGLSDDPRFAYSREHHLPNNHNYYNLEQQSEGLIGNHSHQHIDITKSSSSSVNDISLAIWGRFFDNATTNSINDNFDISNHKSLSDDGELVINDIIDKNPLHVAVSMNDPERISQLLDEGANIDSQDENGTTPLHLASAMGHALSIRTLLEYYPDVNVRNQSMETPLSLCISRGHTECATILMDHISFITSRYSSFRSTNEIEDHDNILCVDLDVDDRLRDEEDAYSWMDKEVEKVNDDESNSSSCLSSDTSYLYRTHYQNQEDQYLIHQSPSKEDGGTKVVSNKEQNQTLPSRSSSFWNQVSKLLLPIYFHGQTTTIQSPKSIISQSTALASHNNTGEHDMIPEDVELEVTRKIQKYGTKYYVSHPPIRMDPPEDLVIAIQNHQQQKDFQLE